MLGQPIRRSGGQLGQAICRGASQRAFRPRRWYAAEAEAAAAAAASPKPPKSSPFRRGLFLAVFGAAFSVLGALGTVQVLQSQGVGFLSDEQSLRAFRPEADDEEARFAEETINKHPLVAALRARADLHESRPHLKLPEDRRSLNLTAGTLMGPRRMAVPPYAWADAEGREFVSVMYAGDQMCGHAPFVHGGMLATILDEGLAFCCFKALPHGTAVTANLNVDYRKPARSPGFFVLRAETQRVEGRKAWVKGRIETLPTKPGEAPIVVAEATALYISPKYAALLNKFS